jgi:hypothetical protein
LKQFGYLKQLERNFNLLHSVGLHCGPRSALLAWSKDKNGLGGPAGRHSVVRSTHGHRAHGSRGGMTGDGCPVLVAGLGRHRKHEGGHGSTLGKLMEGGSHCSGLTSGRW